MTWRFLLCLLAASALAGCGVDAARGTGGPPVLVAAATASATPSVEPAPAQAIPATPTSSPAAPATATPTYTATPTPSNTPAPSPTALPSPTPTPCPPTPAPLIDGDALDLSLGWRLDANGHLTAAAASTGGASRSYLASLGRTVYAVDARGQVIWRQKTAGPVYALAAVAGGGVATGDDAGWVTLFDADGKQIWRAALGTRVTALAAAPTDAGGLFVGGWDERITRLDLDGSVAWQAAAGGPVSAIAVLPPPADLVAVATMDGELRAYDTGGRQVWRSELDAPIAALGALPTAADPLLLAGIQDGHLLAIDARGSVAWQIPLGDGAPVWQAAELSPGTWSILAGTAGAEPALVHLSAAGDIHWSISLPAPVTAVAVHDLDAPADVGLAAAPEIVVGLSTGELLVCDAQGRRRAAVHAGLPVSGLAVAPDGSLLVRADVVAWQVHPGPGATGGPWLRVPSLAPAGLPPVATGEAASSGAVLLFLGDVSPGRSMEAQLLRFGPGYPWRGLTPLLPPTSGTRHDTLLVVNLEAVLSTRGEALSKPYLIRAHPLAANMLAAGGVGLVTLAHNHILDYGPQGLDDTLAALDDLGIVVAGAGVTPDEAHRPAQFTLNGVRVALLSYAAARWDGSPDVPHTDRIAWAVPSQVSADVSAARPDVDLVVVLLHAGTEYAAAPSPDQVAVAHAAVDAGADLVVGHHPHVTQTVERYKEGLIVYSLGDAIFDIPRQAAMAGHLLRVQIGSEGIRAAELWPFWIEGAIQPRLLDDGAGGVRWRPIYP